MIVSKNGNVSIEGKAHILYADFGVIARAMLDSGVFDEDEILQAVKTAIEYKKAGIGKPECIEPTDEFKGLFGEV